MNRTLNLLGDEILECGHLHGFGGDLVGQVRRDDDDALAIADHDVAGEDGRVAATDRFIDPDGLVHRQVGGRHVLELAAGKRSNR